MCARVLDEGSRQHDGEEFAELLETEGAGFGIEVALAGLQAILDVPVSHLSLDADRSHRLWRTHPHSLRDVLEAILNGNGERCPRAWFAAVLPGDIGHKASRLTTQPREIVPYTLPKLVAKHRGQREEGSQGLKDTAVERRKASWPSHGRHVLLRRSTPQYNCAFTALRSLFWEHKRSLPCSGANRKENLTLARKIRSENGGAWPGEVGTGSPSGHATKKKRRGCLTIGSEK